MSTIISHGRNNFKSALTRSQALRQLLDGDRFRRVCHAAGHRWRESFWSPSTTLLGFLLQVAHPVKSLRTAVAELLTHLVSQGVDAGLPSADPSAFAQARRRLPLQAIRSVFLDSVTHLRTLARPADLWRHWRVIVIDGSNVSMPDTAGLQKAFPQHGQKPGCGFPQANMVMLFDWRSGGAIDFRMGSSRDSEASLFRQMLDHFDAGTVALADRYYCSYVDIARITGQGGDVVFRLHKRRQHDFRTGVRLGKDDCLMTWHRPQWIPSFGISREAFEQLPDQMTLRLVRTSKTPRGFRSRQIVIVTTILDPQEASHDQLLALYRDRWLAELNIRSLKTTMGMEFLRGHSVDVVTKEVLMHLLLYNIIRLLMWEAARMTPAGGDAGEPGESVREVDPRRLSFAGTLHRLQSLGATVLAMHAPPTPHATHDRVLTALLGWIARDVVPRRPERFEPRRVKRRPKNYSRLTQPRKHYHTHGDNSCR